MEQGSQGASPGPTVEALLEKVAELTAQDRQERDPQLERRIRKLRHRAGAKLMENGDHAPAYPEPDVDSLPAGDGIPEVSAAELTPALVRAAILQKGSLLARGLVEREEAEGLVEKIDLAFQARETRLAGNQADSNYYLEFSPDQPYKLLERRAVTSATAMWAGDSPALLVDILDLLERAGLRDLARGYFGEQPAVSVNKFTIRRVPHDQYKHAPPGKGWHQDGAFMGERGALNVWLALSRCGDVAPGLDIVPRRLDQIVTPGTEGADFDWSVSPAAVQEAAGDAGIARSIFEPGDALLFDEMALHGPGLEPEMRKPRYAIETWFFGPSSFPERYTPLAF